ncbi:hypothetical protein [Stenotrophomonas sp. JAG2]|uniref:hypothetical protein n=1 Tax=Stenotrophomonas sp. JAG2 TaxID=3229243 RepID=UPI0034E2230A
MYDHPGIHPTGLGTKPKAAEQSIISLVTVPRMSPTSTFMFQLAACEELQIDAATDLSAA